VRACYDKALVENPNLTGRVIIKFTIAGSGKVVAAVVQETTLNHPQVERCMADATLTWLFPKPQGGGIVIVSYPFVLRTDPRK
jgi:hypothetical protein